MGAQAHNGRSFDPKVCSSVGGGEEYDNGTLEPPRILAILASTLEKSILKNEKLLKATNVKDVITIFHGLRAPELSIRRYIERIFKYANCSPSCFVVAYIYMERFLHQTNGYLTSLNAHRLLITCFMLAAKFVEDECYNNAYYAKVGGISTTEMNRLETKLVVAIDFRLHVSVETFDDYSFRLEDEASREQYRIERPFRLCGLGKGSNSKDGSGFAPKAAGCTCRAT
ncbi:unnamed protein product [Coffea canephora]|uniref:Cyclin-like domain-containing protein n=1 Tax=Coffea canephora TaxID=49390 RepID=A0A068V4R6_COFCA|nr:unnamed protein product [Coffea canephora]